MVDQDQTYADKFTERNRTNDRVIVLKQKEGEKALNSIGMVDKRLFTGDNKLHAILNPETSLWSLRFEKGLLPGGLDQRFTSFSKALVAVREYYAKRNIEVSNVIE